MKVAALHIRVCKLQIQVQHTIQNTLQYETSHKRFIKKTEYGFDWEKITKYEKEKRQKKKV